MKYTKIVFCIFIVATIGAYCFIQHAQPTPIVHHEEEGEEDKELPNDWMYSQRAYPDNEFSLEKYQSAIKQVKTSKLQVSNREAPWIQAGPTNIGGRITDIALDPSDPSIFYAASALGGVYKTTDEGESFTSIFDNVGPPAVGNIGIAPSNPQVLYVGTGEANGSATSGAFFGDGVYKTTDAGNSWTHVGLENSQHIGRIVVNPIDENEAYVAAAGILYGKNEHKGLYKTTDGGDSWDKVFYLSDSTSCIDVAINPQFPNIVYACMWERVRRPWQRSYGGVTSGIYRSVDAGQTWTQLTNGLPASDSETGRIGIAIAPSDPNILYATYTTNSITNEYNGVYRSDDGGDSWYLTPTEDISYVYSFFGWFFGNIRVAPDNPDEIFLMGVSMLHSVDGGSTWSDITFMHVDQHGLEIHPLTPNFVVAGNDGGVYTSDDISVAWNHKIIPNTQFYNVEIDPVEPNYLFGGTQDNNTVRTSGFIDGYDRIIGGDGFHVRVDPEFNNFVYGESQWGNLRRSEDHGDNFNFATNGIDPEDRKNWNTPFTIDPNETNVLYYGSQRLYKSTDRALSWVPISDDLTDGQHPSGTLSFGTLTAVDVCKASSQYIATGSDDGNVHVTFDGGLEWLNVSAGIPKRFVTEVAFHPENPDKLFVTLSGYKYLDYLPHVLMTENLGSSWIDISGNLPEIPVNDIIIDPMDPDNTYYIANDVGVWMTSDGGSTWEIFGEDLPIVAVNDLAFDEATRKMAAGTFGRSIWTTQVPEIIFSGTTESAHTDLKVYPNPAQNEVTISFTLEQLNEGSIELYDMQGKVVQTIANTQFTAGENKIVIPRNGLSAGQYVVKLNTDKQIISQKVLLVD